MNTIISEALDHPLHFDDYAEAVAHGFLEEAGTLQALNDYDYSFRLGDALIKASAKPLGMDYTVLSISDQIDGAVIELLKQDAKDMGYSICTINDLNRYGAACRTLYDFS